jgi:hypothetical protein
LQNGIDHISADHASHEAIAGFYYPWGLIADSPIKEYCGNNGSEIPVKGTLE